MRSNRRAFLNRTWATGFGALYGSRFQRALAVQEPSGRFKRCLVLWMEGGPSQQDTFDPKPGPRPSIPTNVPDLAFAETLGGLAERADQLCVLRSVGSREGEHARATELLHTGFSPLPSFPRPSIGSIVSHHRTEAEAARPATPGVPRYVVLGGNGFGPAFLGSQHGPFVVEDVQGARNQLERVQQKRRAMQLLTRLNDRYATSTSSASLAERSSDIESVEGLLDTGFADSLNLESVSAQKRRRYGDHPFGQRLLTASRLLRLGVPFVEAQLGGWDTHVDNQRRTEQLCRQLEQPWLALMDDLQASGLWDDTLLVWMGEFGRTPRLNGRAGRDHFPEATPVVLAGGALGGRVIGATNDEGSRRVGETHSVADLTATLLTLLGLDIDDGLTTDFGSPTTITDDGVPIADIVTA